MFDETTSGPGNNSPVTNGLTHPVVIPLLQAVITGVLVGLLAGVATALFKIPVNAWGVMLIFMLAGMLYSWLKYLARWQHVIEWVLGVDLDGDGYVGDPTPAPAPPPIRVEVVQDHGNTLDILDLPHPEKVPLLAAHVTAGRAFAMDATAHILSRDQFIDIREALVGRGFAHWRVPGADKQGVELTVAGRAIFKKINDTYPPTLTRG